ncbi:zinc finger protein ZFAT-like [Plodia interpunctella]|uniref:zinc finger protein ZFAT-like n=1 Tax=Plodia interpunctella TaxID=58824 RepID=UPI0023677F74|nr:zinc finger protein ZFAT-like [Plodia interpunctella]XP_053621426.1 zinc finger protein ZFAT-like [Plodia interpunctella]XP_053621429.1 zinc finger protein ZFAT-like [Plodia interpunctella]
MSDEDVSVHVETPETLLTTEFRDGQLQIVEVAPFKHGNTTETQILPDLDEGETPEPRFVQVLNADKSVVQLDLLNMTLVRCDDGSDTTYKLVTNTEHAGADAASDTVTCVLQASDQEDQDNQDAFVVMDGADTPLVFLQPEIVASDGQKHEEKDKGPSPSEILERAKALKQTAEAMQSSKPRRTGRKRKSAFPSPHELLASPNFKLFLYSCKLCHFKCNAVKEMTAHKSQQHSGAASPRARGGRAPAPLQCAKCPYKATSHSQLMKHVQERHLTKSQENVISLNSLDSKDVEEAHVLVCGACGFECNTKVEFKVHIREQHGTSAVSI